MYDKTLTCAECGTSFIFSSEEQEFFAQQGFSEPRRYRNCRALRRAGRATSTGVYGTQQQSPVGPGPREMFTAICAQCGREAQVPFQPQVDRPVYCAECFAQRRTVGDQGGRPRRQYAPPEERW